MTIQLFRRINNCIVYLDFLTTFSYYDLKDTEFQFRDMDTIFSASMMPSTHSGLGASSRHVAGTLGKVHKHENLI